MEANWLDETLKASEQIQVGDDLDSKAGWNGDKRSMKPLKIITNSDFELQVGKDLGKLRGKRSRDR